MICKKCGTELPGDIKKCPSCGADIEAMNADESGDDFNTGADFYDNTSEMTDGETKVIDPSQLGSALAAEAASGASQPAAEASEEIFDENEKRRREQMQKRLADKQKQLSEIERRRTEKRRREKRKKIAIIAVVCALVAAAAGIGAYSVLSGTNNDNTITQTPSPAPTSAASAEAITPSPDASPAATDPAAAPASSAEAEVNSSRSWTATGNSSSGNTSDQRTASNTGSQKSKTSSGSGSPSGSTGGPASTGSSSGSSAGGPASGSTGGSPGGSPSQPVTNSGLISEPISSKLVSGGEVIYNTGTGRYLMTFTMDGKKYYANVSEGSTTEQIQNKPFTIDAEATQESYNGNTVYEISSMTNYSGDYLLEDSGTRLLTESDLSGMSKYDLALARNEIFARHGRKFQTAEYNAYFSSKSWYKINPNYNYSDENSNLNSTEIRNVEFILNAEKQR